MADGKIEVDARINTKNLKKDTKSLESNIKSIGSKFSELKKSIGMSAVITGEINALKKEINFINQCNEAWKTQNKVEKQLELSAKNNPYINSEGVKQLKDFASEMQNLGNVGDEQLMPFLSQLVASGRNMSEVQEITKAALDLSASGVMSLDQAITSLNASYTGNIGQLGKLVPQARNLTTEELKQGKAVELVAKAFQGQYEAAKDIKTQIANAKGDFMEALGGDTSAIDSWWLKFYQKGTETVKKIFEDDNFLTVQNANQVFDSFTTKWKNENVTNQTEREFQVAEHLRAQTKEANEWLEKYLSNQIQAGKKLTDVQNIFYSALKRQKAMHEENEKAQSEMNKALADEKAKQDAVNQKNADAQDLIKANSKALETELEKIQAKYDLQKAETGTIDEVAKMQEELNAKEQAYISLITTDTSLVTANNSAAKERLADIKKGYQDIAALTPTDDSSEPRDLSYVLEEIDNLSKDTIDTVQYEIDAIVNSTELAEEEKYTITEAWEKKKQELRNQSLQTQLESINSFINQYSSALSTLSEMWQTQAENEASVQSADLEKQYADGLISEEEYYEQKEKIEKESAQKSYKLQMWAWSAQLLQIMASTAQSMVQTLADETLVSTAAKIAMMTTVGALGSAQLAAAIASKPTPPSYSTGGFLLGNSTSGDKIPFMGNSGEAILNPAEMRTFMDMANGNYSGGGLNVNIKNYMGGQADVSAGLNGNDLIVTIRKTVQSDLASGRYSEALISAQNLQDGVSYTS